MRVRSVVKICSKLNVVTLFGEQKAVDTRSGSGWSWTRYTCMKDMRAVPRQPDPCCKASVPKTAHSPKHNGAAGTLYAQWKRPPEENERQTPSA